MKKLLCILTAICILAMTMGTVVMAEGETLEVWDGTTEAPAGSGTAADPYLIANGKNLAWLSAYVVSYDKDTEIYAKQTNHILMNDADDFAYDATTGKVTGLAADAVAGETVFAFEPIGTASTSSSTYSPFNGVFDGNGYEIRNLYISDTGYAGLFEANEGTLKNIKVTSGFIKSTGNYVAAIVGYAAGWYNASSVVNCYSDATVNGKQYVGGIVGRSGGILQRVLVEGCVNEGTVVASNNNAGGLVGQVLNYTTINNCLNSGALKAKLYMGAFAGAVADGSSSYPNGGIVITNSLNMNTSFANTSSAAYGSYIVAGQGAIIDKWTGTISNIYSVTANSPFNKKAIWRTSDDKNGSIDAYTGVTEASVLASFDMALNLNGVTETDYVNSGAWTYNTGDAHPTPAGVANDGGVYKFGVTNGGTDVIASDYLKSTTGAAKLIVAKNNGQIANVINVDLKTMNTQDIADTLAGDSAKVMLWDGFETLIPIVQAENVQ